MTLGFIGYCQEGKRSAAQVQTVLTQGRDSFNCGVMIILGTKERQTGIREIS